MSVNLVDVVLAEEELRRLGYDVAIFSFDHVQDKKLGPEHDPVVTDVLVTNTESRKQMQYSTRQGVPWHIQFVEDLRSGVFGSPPKGLDGPRDPLTGSD